MQQLRYIIINNSTCFGHLYAQLHVQLFMIINHNCCIKLIQLVIFVYDARSHIHKKIIKSVANEFL